MKTQTKADLMLLAVVLFWGVSYLLVDISLTDVETFNLNALRFLIAFFAAALVAWPKLKGVNLATLGYAALLGLILVFVYMGATYGVMYTSLSNAGFLCALTVVFTPLLGFFFKGQKPEKRLAVAVLFSLVGIALLSLNNQLIPAKGDLFCLFCALAYAVHLLLTETAVARPKIDAFQLGVFQLGFAGFYQLFVSFLMETPGLPQSPKTWVSVLVLSVFCTGLAFIVQTVAQQYTSATHVGVIFSLEPVFAAAVAFFLAGEILTVRAYLGAILLLCGLFIMEINFGKKTASLDKKNTN